MFIAKLKVNAWITSALALLVCFVFSGESTLAATVFKHYNNPVVRKIKCPKDYSIGTLHIVPANVSFGHELDDPHHYHVAARGDVTVTVPEGQMLLLDLNGSIATHPGCLKEISAPALECLRSVSTFSMDDNFEQSMEDALLENLHSLQTLERLNLDRSDVTDKGLAYIRNLPRLNSLGLYECGVIKGDTFNALSTCPNLQFLNIGDCTAFKIKNYAALSKFSKLEEFQATNTTINDQSLQYLSQSRSLKIIDLRKNKAITDKGLRTLMSLKTLERLLLDETSVTADGIKSLAPLKLKVVNVPGRLAESPSDLAELKKALPGTAISVLKKNHNKLVRDINGWFSSP
jgi:hypothetical protein